MYSGVFKQSLGLLLLFIILFPRPDLFAQISDQAPVTDFRGTDLGPREEIAIEGLWKFYWNNLIPPDSLHDIVPTEYVRLPHLWNEDPSLDSFGSATYTSTLYLPSGDQELALRLPDMYTSYRLYINGELAAENGTVGTNEEEYKPYWLPQIISLDPFRADSLSLVLHIANFEHHKGGIRLPIFVGSMDYLTQKWRTEFGVDIFLTGCIFMLGMLFLGLYAFGRHEITMCCFAVVCFFFSYRIAGTELYALHYMLPSLPWWLTVKLEYLTLFGIGFSFSLFVLRLYPDEIYKKLLYPFAGFFGLYGLVTIFFPAYYFTKYIDLFFITFPFFALYITWVYVKAVRNNREGSRIALASTAFVFIVIIHKLLVYNGLINENMLFYISGVFFFFFLQSLVLIYRYTNSLSRARIEAEEAAIAKSQFLSAMSHEIRTPLNAIIGFADLLKQSKTEDEQKKFAHIIKDSGQNLLELINKILEYSKFESTGIKSNYEPVHLRTVSEDVIKLLAPLHAHKDLQISLDIQDKVPEWVRSDSTHLKQILMNLIGNAIKFTDQGSIHINLTLNDSPERKGNLLFTIKDTGKGIAESDNHRLFKSFSQADPSSTREHGGAGLGLALSEKLVSALKGEIWFESTLNEGSAFYFSITADAIESPLISQETTNNISDSLPKELQELKILVAEDNLLNQKVLIKILERKKLKAVTVKDGKEALEIAMQQPYDLIFMDMEMPVMDGLEATREIRRQLPGNGQPVIVAITANAFPEDRIKCMEAGMNDFITKPISVDAIADIIQKWF